MKVQSGVGVGPD